MQVLILAGGFAKRMGKLGEKTPKALLPIAGKPVIEHILEKIESLDNIKGISISTNRKFGGVFKEWNHRSGNKPVSLVIEPAMAEGQKLGSIGALQYFIDKKRLDEDLLVINGDNIFTFELGDFTSFAAGKETLVLTAYDTKDLNEARKMGVLSVDDDGKVTYFVEKPENPKSTLVSPGIYFYPHVILPKINEYLEKGENPDTIGYFHTWLYKQQEIMAYIFDKGDWFDIGTPETYKKAEEQFGKGVDNV